MSVFCSFLCIDFENFEQSTLSCCHFKEMNGLSKYCLLWTKPDSFTFIFSLLLFEPFGVWGGGVRKIWLGSLLHPHSFWF